MELLAGAFVLTIILVFIMWRDGEFKAYATRRYRQAAALRKWGANNRRHQHTIMRNRLYSAIDDVEAFIEAVYEVPTAPNYAELNQAMIKANRLLDECRSEGVELDEYMTNKLPKAGMDY